MKFTLLTTILPLACAWTLDVWTTDDRSSAMHGTVDVDCNDIEFTPPLDINRVKFNPDTDWYPDPDTFEFYVSPGCQGLSYRNGEGDYTITPRVVQSYKVY